MKIFFFFFLLFSFQYSRASPTLDIQSDLLIRYHGERIHIKVIPHDKELYPHVIEASLCSAVDLNMGIAGCKTSGFVMETLVVADASKRVKENRFDARLPSSGAGLSFKPIQVIKDWPLVYVEMGIKMKIPGKGWAANGEIVRKIARIDRSNIKAGEAFGMKIPTTHTMGWKGYAGLSLIGLFTLLLIVSFIQRKIIRTRKNLYGIRPYARDNIYPFSGGNESGCDFRALINSDTMREKSEREDKETQLEMERIAIQNGMLIKDDIDWL